MWGWTILLGLLALAEGNNIVVEHSLTSNGEGPIYQTRGVIELGANSAAFKQEPLREADAVSLKRLIENDGLYYVRVATGSGHVSTLVRACLVGASKLKDTLGIHFDDAETVIGLEYAPSNRTCTSTAFVRKLGEGAAFKTTVKLHTKGLPGPAPVIDVGGAGPGGEAAPPAVEYDAEGRPIAKAPPQEPGFLQKYWMYILPAVILFNMAGAPPQEGDNQNQNQAQNQGNQGNSQVKPPRT